MAESCEAQSEAGYDTGTVETTLQGSPGSRVGCIVKMLTEVSSHSGAQSVVLLQSLKRLRCRGDVEELFDRMLRDRRDEVANLGNLRCVSGFKRHGKIKSILKLRILQRQAMIRDATRAPSTSAVSTERINHPLAEPAVHNEWNRENGSEVKENVFHQEHQDDGKPTISISTQDISTELSIELKTRGNDKHVDQHNRKVEEETLAFNKSMSQSVDDQLEEYDPHEEAPSPECSWEERNSWTNSPDWNMSMESTSPSIWQQNSAKEHEFGLPFSFNDCPWLCDYPNSWRVLCASGKADSKSIFDNVDIRSLLNSKLVSMYLVNGFSKQLNQVLLRKLHKLRQQSDEFEEREEGEACTGARCYLNSHDQDPSTSSSLVPPPCSWESTPVAVYSSRIQSRLLQGDQCNDEVHFLRSEVAQVRQELETLRRFRESLMDWQLNLQESIQQDVNSAVQQAVKLELTSRHSDQQACDKATCVVCHKAPVDTLFYRCGHMSTCFSCAVSLQSTGGKCPICRSSIVDVVRPQPLYHPH